jgi:hypothetical protein
MRWAVAPLILLTPAAASAQTTSTDPGQSRVEVNSEAVERTLESTSRERSSTLAGGTRKAQMSKNEAYNLGRAASGRLGVRVGNDMSFPVGKDGI